MYTASGSVMAQTIGQSHFFMPSLLTSTPPMMPPNSKPMMPTNPWAKPYSPSVSPKPPSVLGRIRKVLVIVLSSASGKRYSKRNTMAKTVSFHPNLLKKVTNINLSSLAMSEAFFSIATSSLERGITRLWYSQMQINNPARP